MKHRPLLGLAILLATAACLPPLSAWAEGQTPLWTRLCVFTGLLALCFSLALHSGSNARRGVTVLAQTLAALGLLALAHARVLDRDGISAHREQAFVARPRALSSDHEQIHESAARRRWIGEQGWLRPGERVLLNGEAVALRPVHGKVRDPVSDPVEGDAFLPWLSAAPSTPAHDWLPDELVRAAPPSGGAAWEAGWMRVRERARLRLEVIEDERTLALCIALLLGDTRELAEADEQRFVRSGIYHLLVVSGTQVALLSALFFLPLARWLLGRIGRTGRTRADPVWLAALCVGLYVPIAGGCAPVLRAGLVWVLGSLAPRCEGVRPRVDGVSLWALALCVECLFDPLAPRSLSVQLSYGATLGLIVGTAPLLALWRERAGECGLDPVDTWGRARPEWLVAISARLGSLLRAALASSVVATITTLPILCAHFGEVASLGMLATVLCAPLAAWLLIVSAALALSGAALPSWLQDGLLEIPGDAIHMLAVLFDALPGSPWCPPERPVWLLALVSGLALLAIRRASLSGMRWTLVLTGGLLLPWTAAPRQAQSLALEVGHGTAVLHRALDGRVLLFDAGTRERTGLRRELALLLAEWEGELDTVVLSHRDSDHANALAWLVQRHKPDLYAGPRTVEIDAALPASTQRVDLRHAGVLELGSGRWLVRGESGDDNEGSRSLLLESPQGWLLWCGDAETGGLAMSLRLLQAWSPPYACVLLPHHGASTPHLGALLEQCQPAELWISAGPRMDLAGELERRGVRWRWTERDGPLTLPR